MHGEIHPQGAKNEVLQILCATLLTSEEVTVTNIPDILDVNNLIQLLRDMGVKVSKTGIDSYTFKADTVDLNYLESDEFLKKCSILIPRKKRSLYLKRLIYIFGSSDCKKLNKNMYNSFIKVVNEDLKCYYSYISTKTLLIWGKKDKSTPVRDAKYMKRHIKDSTLFIYPKAGHFSYLEYIEVTNQIIEEFLEN